MKPYQIRIFYFWIPQYLSSLFFCHACHYIALIEHFSLSTPLRYFIHMSMLGHLNHGSRIVNTALSVVLVVPSCDVHLKLGSVYVLCVLVSVQHKLNIVIIHATKWIYLLGMVSVFLLYSVFFFDFLCKMKFMYLEACTVRMPMSKLITAFSGI